VWFIVLDTECLLDKTLMFVICERAVFSHDIIKVAEFLTHGKDIYHTKVHF